MKSLVSIIILTYNRSVMLKSAIESVLNQTYQHFEIIIVDDGSEDNTEETVLKYADDRIVYLKLAYSGVISFNRNKGLENSSGEYIAFLDSDDIWDKMKLEKQLDLMRDLNVGFTFCEAVIQDESSYEESYMANLKGKDAPFKADVMNDIIFNKLVVYPSALMIRREVLEEVGSFDTSRSISETNFIGRLSARYRAYVDPRPWVRIIKHSKNTSSSNIRHQDMFAEKFDLAQILFFDHKISKNQYKKSLALHYYALANMLEDTREIRHALKSCIKYSPLFFKAYYRMLSTILNPLS